LGNTASIDNDILDTYPLLEAYLNLEEKPPARFILLNQYGTYGSSGMQHKPETLSEAGLILSETLKSTEEIFGTLDQLVCFSLGGIVTAAALPHFHNKKVCAEESSLEMFFHQIAAFISKMCERIGYPLQGRITIFNPNDETVQKTERVFKSLPKNIVFDRAPSSIEKLSDRYTGGQVLAVLAKASGWTLDLGKNIAEFVETCDEAAPSIVTVSALRDFRFKGEANLHTNPHIQQLVKDGKVTSLALDIPSQLVHPHAQHSLGTNIWNRFHLEEGFKDQSFLEGNDSLAAAIIKKSLPNNIVEA